MNSNETDILRDQLNEIRKIVQQNCDGCLETDRLAESALDAALELVDARLRPNTGGHRNVKYNAEHRYRLALNEYAASLAAGADPVVWGDKVNMARKRIAESKKALDVWFTSKKVVS